MMVDLSQSIFVRSTARTIVRCVTILAHETLRTAQRPIMARLSMAIYTYLLSMLASNSVSITEIRS
jgi:hypothetical protein